MAQRATGLAKGPAVRRSSGANGAKRAAADKRSTLHAIPLDLAPLLAPYKGHGRLALRVEGMPLRSRLSRGRNNGDNTWSLASDELEDLEFLSPEGSDKTHTLAIRIIARDGGEASTVAVLDLRVSPDASARAAAGATGGTSPSADADKLRALQDELAKLRDELSAREAELGEARQAAEQAAVDAASKDREVASARAREAELEKAQKEMVRAGDTAAKNLEAELARARKAWDAETIKRLAAATAHSASELERERATWKAKQDAEIAALEARADKRMAEARTSWEREAADALAKAEKTWKAEEAARLTAAKTRWKDDAAKALDAARASTDAARNAGKTELEQLRGQLAQARAALADREKALAAAQAAAAEEDKRRREEAEAALAEAREAWKTEEAARLGASEAGWRKEAEGALAALKARCEKAEAALADAHKSASATDDEARTELRRLREDLSQAKAALEERDAALGKAQLAVEAAKVRGREDGEAALAKARDAWKAEEAARLAEDQARWKAESERALAEMSARCERAEAALKEARDTTDSDAARDREAAELSRMRDELAAAQTALAAREEELARARSEGEAAAAALAKAESAWKASEAERFAQAEAQWGQRSDGALAEATARYQAAELALSELRMRSRSTAQVGDPHMDRLHDEIARLQATLGERDAELARIRTGSAGVPGVASSSEDGAPAQRSRGLVRDVVLVMALVVAAIMLYPKVETLISNIWPQPTITIVDEEDGADAPALHQTASQSPSVADQRMAVIVRGVNLRAGPSTHDKVVTTLKRGVTVAIVEERGKWTRVRLPAHGKSAVDEGWVYNTYLKEAAAAAGTPKGEPRK